MPSQELTNNQLLQLINKKIDEQFEKLSEKIDSNYACLNQKIGDINGTVSQLKTENSELKERVEVLENKIRKKNIAIFGLKPNKNRLLNDTLEKLNAKLTLNLNVADISNIFKPGNDSSNSPVILEFVSYIKKVEVFKNVSKLKGTGIFITNDMTKEERNINKILREKLKEAKEKKKTAKIIGKKIIIEGTEYSYTDFIQEKIRNVENTEIEDTSDSDNANDPDGGGMNSASSRHKKPVVNTRSQRKNPPSQTRPEKKDRN